MIELDYTTRFKKSLSKLSSDQQLLVRNALKLFVGEPHHQDLDFKKRSGSKYYTIRADIRLRIAMTKVGDRFYLLELTGNHDDINSLDRQKR
ncbi:hypothetical protein [Phyllobacterium bourgognense]|uniref:mRNA-degrading endonuclease RelE of RelBE toxin-antitoxin system n=1 Tax=Phyllobacterium bourgognense TaxID=314236 RepID=A0A368YK91_9HYPH|nr:hypothetical protein [Phyllobacterium bourgognense]RCW79327.1 hypothetical protein C7476_11839 [Phyllobacterium bourgognense]